LNDDLIIAFRFPKERIAGEDGIIGSDKNFVFKSESRLEVK
jgi:hypothetical protein